MQIRALIYFDELVRTNSMRQAAENLNVAPTAISRQIEKSRISLRHAPGRTQRPWRQADRGRRAVGGSRRTQRCASSTMCTSSSKT